MTRLWAPTSFVASVLLALACRVTPQQPRPTDPAWEKTLEAKGGRSRLYTVQSFVVSEPFRGEDDETVVGLPDRVWLWEDGRPDSVFWTRVWNRRAHFDALSRGGAAADVPKVWNTGTEAQMTENIVRWQLVYFLETAYVEPTVVTTARTGDTIVVEALAPGFRIRYRIDSANQMVKAVTLTPEIPNPSGVGHAVPAPFSYEYAFADWTTVDGIQMPRRVQLNGQWADVRFLVNPDLAPEIFETSPEGVRSKTDWRKWLRSERSR